MGRRVIPPYIVIRPLKVVFKDCSWTSAILQSLALELIELLSQVQKDPGEGSVVSEERNLDRVL